MFKKIFILGLILLILMGSVSALRYNELSTVSKANFLLIDDNESVVSTSYSKIKCNDYYWVGEVNNGTDFVYLNDSKPEDKVENSKSRKLLETYMFYSYLTNNYYTSQVVNYYVELGRALDSLAYNIGLISSELETQDGTENFVDDLSDFKNIITKTSDLTLDTKEDVEKMREIFFNEEYDCSNLDNIEKNLESMQSNLKQLDLNISSITKENQKLRAKVQDLNLSLQLKLYISNLLELSNIFDAFSEQKASLDESNDVIENALKKNSVSFDKYIDAWQLRKERSEFLKVYVGPDEIVSKNTDKETVKELSDHILINKKIWEAESKVNEFSLKYEKMEEYLSDQSYIDAKKLVPELRTLSLSIVNTGYMQVDPVDEGKESNLWTYILIAVGILILLLLPTIIKAIRSGASKEEDPIIEEDDEYDFTKID
jgi:hypothetical protein